MPPPLIVTVMVTVTGKGQSVAPAAEVAGAAAVAPPAEPPAAATADAMSSAVTSGTSRFCVKIQPVGSF